MKENVPSLAKENQGCQEEAVAEFQVQLLDQVQMVRPGADGEKETDGGYFLKVEPT